MNKQNLHIIVAFVVIALILLFVAVVLYVPVFGCRLSESNADWGAFGNFFWGLGTMLLTGLNVYVFYRLTTTIEVSRKEREERALAYDKKKLEIDTQQSILKDLQQIKRLILGEEYLSINSCMEIVMFKGTLTPFENLFPSLDEKTLQSILEKTTQYESYYMRNKYLLENPPTDLVRRVSNEVVFKEKKKEILQGLYDLEKLMCKDINDKLKKDK